MPEGMLNVSGLLFRAFRDGVKLGSAVRRGSPGLAWPQNTEMENAPQPTRRIVRSRWDGSEMLEIVYDKAGRHSPVVPERLAATLRADTFPV